MSDGDLRLGDTEDFKFNTTVNGVPTTLAGSPTLAAYVDNGTVEITAGLTLTVDLDGKTGYHNARVVATSGNGFAAGTKVSIVLAGSGTVGGSSVTNTEVAAFTLEKRFSLLIDGAITAAKIAADALTSAKFADGALTAAKFASGAFDAVWSVAARLLTAGTNIVLAKGVGVTGFNDLSAAQVNTEADTALADYDPPTRAELTSDTNSILSKLLKYAQLTLRKDAAIATDNATEVTAINADGGSGAGAFANTTDAQEALRDRGDAAWADSGTPPTAAAIASQVRTELTTELARVDAAVSSRATPAQVNTEVLDVLNVDTFAEPGQETPAATNTLVKKIGYLFKLARNRVTQTSTQLKVYNDDAVTVDQKATVSDDATTYDRGELGTGP